MSIIPGGSLTARLSEKQNQFEDKFERTFNISDEVCVSGRFLFFYCIISKFKCFCTSKYGYFLLQMLAHIVVLYNLGLETLVSWGSITSCTILSKDIAKRQCGVIFVLVLPMDRCYKCSSAQTIFLNYPIFL